ANELGQRHSRQHGSARGQVQKRAAGKFEHGGALPEEMWEQVSNTPRAAGDLRLPTARRGNLGYFIYSACNARPLLPARHSRPGIAPVCSPRSKIGVPATSVAS